MKENETNYLDMPLNEYVILMVTLQVRGLVQVHTDGLAPTTKGINAAHAYMADHPDKEAQFYAYIEQSDLPEDTARHQAYIFILCDMHREQPNDD